jgi:vacuolar-type H+-ATPase subunit F/Vma7
MAPSGDSMNQYEQYIRAVGEILCPYNSDQLFPVLGFGAKVGGTVQHCFPLTFNPQAPCVSGLAGILGAYRYSVGQVQLAGPTLFAPVIQHASQKSIKSFQTDRTYTILLIVTDNVINDIQDTTDAIVAAGRIPFSIIIVGVGNANFDAMDVLNADDVPLISRTGYKMCRDLVQFVPFNKFANRHYSVLASEVLEEIPRQLCQWAEMNGVYPQG